MSRGVLVVVSGFSGAGKGTIMKSLMAKYDNYALSVSATTRNPRPGEEDGREYFFRTREEFEEMIHQDQLIEYAQYVENYYGTPKAYVEEQLSQDQEEIPGGCVGICDRAVHGSSEGATCGKRHGDCRGDPSASCQSGSGSGRRGRV